MLSIKRIDDRFVAISGDEELGSVAYSVDKNTVTMINMECDDIYLCDGLIRACVAYNLDRGFLFFAAGDDSVKQAFAKMPCQQLDPEEKQHSSVSLLSSCLNCKKSM